jgi:hypothetical protein
MNIDLLFKQLDKDKQQQLVTALNAGKELFFFVGEEFIGVHVYSKHLTITDRQHHWSKGTNGTRTEARRADNKHNIPVLPTGESTRSDRLRDDGSRPDDQRDLSVSSGSSGLELQTEGGSATVPSVDET